MEIIKGKIPCAKKVVVYGPEGIGKSTFASRFPDPVFIDTEGSTNSMDVARLPKPTSWQMILDQIAYIKAHADVCKTLVIDTIDWAESMCIQRYVYVKEEMGRFLNKLTEVVEAGVNVVLTAHAQIRKFEQPDEMGAYDRWELKLGKKTSSQTSPLIKEWADMLLFANYKTVSVATDDKGKKFKAQGGTRVMYTAHHACWDAKNRYGLPEEVPFDYRSIAHILEEKLSNPQARKETVSEQSIPESKKETPKPESVPTDDGQQMSLPLEEQKCDFPAQDPAIPKSLRDLMEANHVDEWDIQAVVAARGYYPEDVKIRDYDTDFINGCLIGAWEQVFGMIKEMKEKQEIPFNN